VNESISREEKMKKTLMLFGLMGILFLSGCSLLGEVNDTVEYANTTTDYLNTTKTFANDVQQLANEAVTDEQARQDLENELITMKEEINQFNNIEAPAIAEDVHNQIVSANTQLEEGIDLYLTNIENGKFDLAFLENSGILTTVNEISSLMENIEKLVN
jgi:PBP1b-binding outer membrane lipoprotein LpoB